MLYTIVEDIINEARQKQIDFVIEGDRVKLRVPRHVTVDQQLLALLNEHKAAIKDWLLSDNHRKENTKIQPVDKRLMPVIPLSFAQERLWFVDRLQGSSQYHIHWVFDLTAVPDVALLERSFRAIVERHEVLRTVLREQEGIGMQVLLPADEWGLTVIRSGEVDGGEIADMDELVLERFDLSSDFMLRVTLLEESGKWKMLVVVHHVAFDGWSMSLLVKELLSHYNGTASSLPALPLQYSDYAIWQRNYLSGTLLEEKLSYWKQQLSGLTPLELLGAHSASTDTRGEVVRYQLSADITASLEAYSRQEGVTLFMTLLSVFNVLLYRYSGQSDICIGTPVAGRTSRELEGLLGFFVNMLPIRSDLSGENSFSCLLSQVKQTLLTAYEHEDIPFEKIVEAVGYDREMNRHPLFDISFALHSREDQDVSALAAAGFIAAKTDVVSSMFNMSFEAERQGAELELRIIYRQDLYSSVAMTRMLTHYTSLLHAVLNNADTKISQLNILPDAEREQLLSLSGLKGVNYPSDISIVSIVTAQAQRRPEAVAVVHENVALTYGELDRRSNQLAHYLLERGVKVNTLVGLCQPRGVELIIGILGIQKAGGGYLPIDPLYPQERINYLLEDSGCSIVVSQQKYKELLSVEVVLMDGDSLNGMPSSLPRVNIPSSSLAYVIYTSGSTGKPKGVMVAHENVVQLFFHDGQLYDFTEDDSWAMFFSCSFDFSVWEIYGALFFGGRLVIIPEKLVHDVKGLGELIISSGITVLNQTPGAFYLLQEYMLESLSPDIILPLRYVIFGGEALTPSRLRAWSERYSSCRMINMYGITETTVHVTYKLLQKENFASSLSNIGKALPTYSCYVADANGELLPFGVTGELYVGGGGVTLGYLHREELTRIRFIADKFGGSNGRLYRSGDLVRWQENGELEYLGRMDAQVKIRGYRIELGEVENVLGKAPGVAGAVVLSVSDSSGDNRLVGYIVATEAYDRSAVQRYLQEQLPAYMIPGVLQEIESIPLTVNGKIDRRRLPAIGESKEREYVAPEGAIAVALSEIWSALLGVTRIGIHDNFFELGGHSIQAIRMIAAIRKALAVEITIKELFHQPTIAGLSLLLEQREEKVSPLLEKQVYPEHIPLSFAQERLWFADHLQGSLPYHLSWQVRLTGPLDVNSLELAFREIVRRHAPLRTVMYEHDGNVYQRELSAEAWSIQTTDRPYDLSRDYMLRVGLSRESHDTHVMTVVIHHIAFDGWSVSIMIKELVSLYNGYSTRIFTSLPELPVQYMDYAIWQRTHQQEQLTDNLLWWKEHLLNTVRLELFTDYPRTTPLLSDGIVVRQQLDKKLVKGLKTLCKQEGTTLFMTMLSIFKVLLYRYSGQEDICVGTSVNNRIHQETEDLIGFFVNMLPLRTEVKGDTSFRQLLQIVKKVTLDAYDHQQVPFEKIIETLNIPRELSGSPLFRVIFVLHNTPDAVLTDMGEVKMLLDETTALATEYDISMHILETEGGIQMQLVYNKALYSAATISRLLGHYQLLLTAAVSDADMLIKDMPLLTSAEQLWIDAFNATGSRYPVKASIISLFGEQVLSTPDTIALVYEQEHLTYRLLDQRSNQVSHYLQGKGVKAGDLVGVKLPRSADLIIAILGILKTGAGYVPIDPGYPADRINYMLSDSGVELVLTAEDIAISNGYLSTDLSSVVSADSIAYLMYTSGSTGRPKGVAVTHGNVVSLVKGVSYVDLSADEVLLSTGSPSFDATTLEYWGMLLNGGRLVMCSEDRLLDVSKLKTLIGEAEVTMMWFTAGWLHQLVDTDITVFNNLRTVLAGGDRLSPAHLRRLRNNYPDLRLINGYGPTENTTFSLTYNIGEVAEGKDIPIGIPLSNRSAYILDNDGHLCPIGVEGELCVGGAGLSPGYHGSPDLTAAKFRDHGKLGLLYHTGDRCRWASDGTVMFMGRRDSQLKIRGYRIELGEIEQVLLQAPDVEQAVVCVLTDDRLMGYVTGAVDSSAVMDYLSAHLPSYMVPAGIRVLEVLPLTSNGKVDRHQLIGLEASTVDEKVYTAPVSDLEINLCRIWTDILEVEQVGIHDDFFELGGHSLLAIRVIAAVRKELHQELSIRDLFGYPTVAGLSAILSGQSSEVVSLKVKARPANIPLSFSQERLWFIDKLQGSVQYHMPWQFTVSGALDIERLETAFRRIVDRHEVLRTVIREQDGVGYQEVLPAAGWKMDYIGGGTAIAEDYLQSQINQPYNLSSDYMLRVTVIEIAENEHLLLIMLHHIAFDGWSISIMVKELVSLYENTSTVLPALPIQYADFAIWQREQLKGTSLQEKLQYWKQHLSGLLPLQLTTDYPRPAVQSTRGSVVSATIDAGLKNRLLTLGQQEGSTLFMTLLTVFNVLLYRYSGQDDICVGTPVAGRRDQELEGLIGFFVNTLALRNKVDGQWSFRELLQHIRHNTLSAYEYQDMPFEKVVDVLEIERDMSRNPVFQVMFALQNIKLSDKINLGQTELHHIDDSEISSLVDIDFDILEHEEDLQLYLRYCPDLYREATVQTMLHHYIQLLEAVCLNADTIIDQLPMLSEKEQLDLTAILGRPSLLSDNNNTITDLFEKWAALMPDHIAVVCEEVQMTYAELQIASGKLAAYLVGKGVQKEDKIAVYVSRSCNMITSMLAVLKSGAAYVPIDADYPLNRINYILENADCKMVITDQELEGNSIPEIISLQDIRETIASYAPVFIPASPGDLAYLIYTSGSTGQPKGVMIEHAGLAHYCQHFASYFSLTAADTVLQQASVSFDTMVEEIYPALITGARVLIVKEGGKDINALKKYIEEGIATILSTTPMVLEWLNKELSHTGNLRYIISGGDRLYPSHINRLLDKTTVVNSYGPSETIVCVTYHTVTKPEHAAYIGKPLPGIQLYISDRAGNMLPQGMAGELCIGGVQLARGYYNADALNHEKFVSSDGHRIYKTGDWVRLLPDGNLEYLGRKDEQIKIRGYRVEPGEIETVLQAAPGVTAAVVSVVHDTKGRPALAAYILGSFDRKAILSYLKESLPDYMVPAILMPVDYIPVTVNGKTDRSRLPSPVLTENSYVAPRTIMEEQLVEIWASLLDVERVGIRDDFFALGGHSLLAVRLQAAVRAVLQYELSIKDIFYHANIEEMAALLVTRSAGRFLSLSAQERPDMIPLSFAQERLWFIDRLQGSSQYHMSWLFDLAVTPDIVSLEHSFRAVVQRHEILRTVLREQDGNGVQVLLPAEDWQLTVRETTDIDALVLERYDLSSDFMLRVTLLEDAGKWQLLVVVHHVAFDGLSMSLLVKELLSHYNSYINGTALSVPVLPLQYSDYAIWQRNYLSGALLEEKLSYWKQQLSGVTPLMLLGAHSSSIDTSSEVVKYKLNADILASLESFSRREGVTLFMTLLSVFKVLLYRYTGQSDICIGTPVGGRISQELENLLGFFVNMLAIRSDVSGETSFSSLLLQVKQTLLDAYEHQDVPFEKIVEAVGYERDINRHPLFDISFALHSREDEELSALAAAGFIAAETDVVSSLFNMSFEAEQQGSELELRIVYRRDLYSSTALTRMLSHYVHLIEAVLTNTDTAISKLDILSASEREQLLSLSGFNDVAHPTDLSIVSVINAQVQRSPEAVAVVYEGTELTYKELDKRSGQLAHYLLSLGVKANTLVGVCLPRGVELIIAILGIQKAGGGYLPIDPLYPQERINYLLEDSGCKIIVSQQKYKELLSGEVVLIDSDEISSQVTSSLPDIPSSSLAYVIYTSGSTGKPKGVMVTHENVVQLFFHEGQLYDFNQDDIWTMSHSCSFDFSVWEIYGALFFGGRLVIVPERLLQDVKGLAALILSSGVTVLNQTPGAFYLLQEHVLESPYIALPLRYVIFGGEALNPSRVQGWHDRYSSCRMINMYGITETTVHVTYKALQSADLANNLSNIGRPLPTYACYVADANGELLPWGVAGELYVGGAGVTAGYLHREELTAVRFIDNKFDGKGRLYRSGDLVRWQENGELEYLGRIDAQVKIRGYRIELGEVESVLGSAPGVSSCVVLSVSDSSGNNRLVGYVVTATGYDRNVVHRYLKEQLPSHMVPGVIQEIDHIPLTANGKTDRRRLPEIGVSNERIYVAPEGAIAITLSDIWMVLLGVPRIGIHDNFFELGGHSIMVIKMIAQIRKRLLLEIPVHVIFQCPSISELCKYIELEMLQDSEEDITAFEVFDI